MTDSRVRSVGTRAGRGVAARACVPVSSRTDVAVTTDGFASFRIASRHGGLSALRVLVAVTGG